MPERSPQPPAAPGARSTLGRSAGRPSGALLRGLRAFALGVAAMSSVSAESRRPDPPPVAPAVVDLSDENGVLINLSPPCAQPDGCPDRREVFVDTARFGVPGQPGGVWLSYDFELVTRPIGPAELLAEDELSLAVRLIISEVGADRLMFNRFGGLEAIGILYTVDNRLEPEVYDPLDIAAAPVFEGCGRAGSFATCANPEQYLGMSSWRALNPRSRYRPALLEAAVDRAVLAWWLQENRLVEDFTLGATNYVHRCGGAAYALTTHHCDAHLGRPRGDVKGANPHTGPIVFRAPASFLQRRGYYSLYESVHVDYAPWWDLTEADAWLAALGTAAALPPLGSGALPEDHDESLDGIADAFGPPEDPELTGLLLRARPQAR